MGSGGPGDAFLLCGIAVASTRAKQCCPLAAMVWGGDTGSRLLLPELSVNPLCLFSGIHSCKGGPWLWFGLFGEYKDLRVLWGGG